MLRFDNVRVAGRIWGLWALFELTGLMALGHVDDGLCSERAFGKLVSVRGKTDPGLGAFGENIHAGSYPAVVIKAGGFNGSQTVKYLWVDRDGCPTGRTETVMYFATVITGTGVLGQYTIYFKTLCGDQYGGGTGTACQLLTVSAVAIKDHLRRSAAGVSDGATATSAR